MLWFYAMQRIPIAEVTAIGYTSPIFVTIGAALFLGEPLAFRRIAAVLVAFAGAVIILRPGLQEISAGQLAQLGAAPLFAASYLMAKSFTSNEDSERHRRHALALLHADAAADGALALAGTDRRRARLAVADRAGARRPGTTR